jgi:hypothetical protein
MLVVNFKSMSKFLIFAMFETVNLQTRMHGICLGKCSWRQNLIKLCRAVNRVMQFKYTRFVSILREVTLRKPWCI